jgi:hypothetical protein
MSCHDAKLNATVDVDCDMTSELELWRRVKICKFKAESLITLRTRSVWGSSFVRTNLGVTIRRSSENIVCNEWQRI